jgi:hypothetical protein
MAKAQSARETDAVIFTCRDSVFRAGDIILAAHFRDELREIWAELVRAVECERVAGDLGLEEDASQALSEQFRYEHDLITAEETEQ